MTRGYIGKSKHFPLFITKRGKSNRKVSEDKKYEDDKYQKEYLLVLSFGIGYQDDDIPYQKDDKNIDDKSKA